MEVIIFKDYIGDKDITINVSEVLNAISPDTAISDNCQYGYTRSIKRHWIEATKRGQRYCTQTKNPKSGEWNNPKKSIYSQIMKLYKDENNKLTYFSLDYNDREDKVKEFVRVFGGVLIEPEREKLNSIIAWDRGSKHIKYTVREHTGTEPTQTEQEKKEIINKVYNYEYRKGKEDDTLIPESAEQ